MLRARKDYLNELDTLVASLNSARDKAKLISIIRDIGIEMSFDRSSETFRVDTNNFTTEQLRTIITSYRGES